jgi:hypothetical protein
LLLWAVKNAVYVFPTTELIVWLKDKIAGRKAIEICAGHGSIGRALDIISTDSFMQTMPEVQAYYRLINAPTTNPPSDVYRFEANEAVDTLKPKVVVGGYVTQLYQEGDAEGIGSSIYGVNELDLVSKIQTYIMIGNEKTHGDKRIFGKYPHEKYKFDWLVTRSIDPSLNCIYIWNNL